MTKPPSAASAAPLAPPPTSATISRRPVSGHTRHSAPSETLVHTSVPSADPEPGGHHTGPSPNSGPEQMTCGPSIRLILPDEQRGRAGTVATKPQSHLWSSPLMTRPGTLGELKASGWVSRPVKEEV